MDLPLKSVVPDDALPTFEDAARAAAARFALASCIYTDKPWTFTFVANNRAINMTLPAIAVAALNRVLAELAAGRGVDILPRDSQMRLEDAAFLLGRDALDLLEALQLLGLPCRGAGKECYVSTEVVRKCMIAAQHEFASPYDEPYEMPSSPGLDPFPPPQSEEEWWRRAHEALYRGANMVTRLSRDFEAAGNGWLACDNVLEYYFGTRFCFGTRPAHWPALPKTRT